MARDARRPPLSGSAFIRTLAALSDAQAPASDDDFAQRVSQWFDWTHAFALSAALSGVTGPVADAGLGARSGSGVDEHELTRLRAALSTLFAETLAGTAGARRQAVADSPDALDFATWRQRYVACQQAMAAQIGPLRRRARAALAQASPALAGLAELDGVMEQVVGAQEHALLASVAGRLEARFEQLRQAHEVADAPPSSAPPSAPSSAPSSAPWLDRVRREMQALLLAELDLRLQPVEGLLQARRSSSTSDRHD